MEQAPWTLVEQKTWSRHQGPWFLWKMSVAGTWVKETWHNRTWDGTGLIIHKKSWPARSPGWTLLELRATPEDVTEVWDRTPIPTGSGIAKIVPADVVCKLPPASSASCITT